jgi:Muramidase (flagellum-specific)
MVKVLIIIFCLLSWGLEAPPVSKVNSSTVIIVEKEEFSKDALWCYILEKGILHPEIAFAQAVLETGNFTSRIFRENNNLFGMKLAKVRPTVATGEQYRHATYCHWQDSVNDYLLWQQMWQKTPIDTEHHYYSLLDRLYAEDQDYVKIVKLVRKQNYELI